MTRQEINTNFIENLERERTSLGLTQAQMAKEVDMSISGYKKMVAGETSKVDLFIAHQMQELTGKGISELCGDDSSLVLQIMSKMRHLTATQLRFVASIVDFETAFLTRVPPEKAEDYISLLTPTGNHEDGMIWDSVNVEKLNVSAYRKRFGADLHCAIRITSDYLYPVYNEGDILLMSKTIPRDGDTGLFINTETSRAYLRKVRQARSFVLEPLNDYGITFTIDNNKKEDRERWMKFGRVLAKMRE
ncbi:MAG: helix-turn-helix domain-containing protein [Muribaculum sp.]|nr:helix-turn-helix domain-containing protein [Muribaculum sp.]